LRAIRRTFDAGLAPGVGDPAPVLLVGAHALRTSAAMAAAMIGHPVFRTNMNLSLQRKADADDRVEFASASPRACSHRLMRVVRIIARFPDVAGLFTAYLKLLSGVNPGAKVEAAEVRL
jgi:hypothetical protein